MKFHFTAQQVLDTFNEQEHKYICYAIANLIVAEYNNLADYYQPNLSDSCKIEFSWFTDEAYATVSCKINLTQRVLIALCKSLGFFPRVNKDRLSQIIQWLESDTTQQEESALTELIELTDVLYELYEFERDEKPGSLQDFIVEIFGKSQEHTCSKFSRIRLLEMMAQHGMDFEFEIDGW